MTETKIPEGWQKVALGEFMEFKNGINADKSAYGQGTKFVNIMDVFRKSFLKKDDITGLVRITDKQLSEYSVIHGDILFNRTSETREEIAYSTVYTDKESVTFGGFVIRGRQKKQLLLPAFAGYCFKNETTRKEMIRRSQGAVRANIGQKDLNKVPILIPPKHEQEKIVQILSRFDTAIGKTEALIASKQKQFKWLLSALIGQRQSSANWDKSKLVEVGRFSKGHGITKEELTAEGTPCIRYGELYTRHNFRIRNFYSFVSRKNAGKYKLIENNDLLFAGSGETREEIGKCASFNHNIEARAGGDVIICSIDPRKLRADFASYYLNTGGRRQLNKLGQGNSIVHIYGRFLKNVEVPVPPLHEQEAITSLLKAGETEINKTKEIAEKYRIQKRGLMHKLLTGQWKTRL